MLVKKFFGGSAVATVTSVLQASTACQQNFLEMLWPHILSLKTLKTGYYLGESSPPKVIGHKK